MQQFIAMSSFDPSEMASIMARPGLLKSSVEIRYFYSVNGFIHAQAPGELFNPVKKLYQPKLRNKQFSLKNRTFILVMALCEKVSYFQDKTCSLTRSVATGGFGGCNF